MRYPAILVSTVLFYTLIISESSSIPKSGFINLTIDRKFPDRTLQVNPVRPRKIFVAGENARFIQGEPLHVSNPTLTRNPSLINLLIISCFVLFSVMGIVVGIAGIIVMMRKSHSSPTVSEGFIDTGLFFPIQKKEDLKHPGCTRILHSSDQVSDVTTTESSFVLPYV